MDKIRLYFLTGFLGSGKTTLLKHILVKLEKKKIGLIINEFGQISVDGDVIEEEGIEIKQLNNGQVFCSCLSHTFIETLVSYAKLPIELLIVETSGLANPVSLENILEDLRKIAGDIYEYCGMLGIIDPSTFSVLRDVLVAVDEQVVRSDYLVINKVDLLEEKGKMELINELRLLNATAPIEETNFGQINADLFMRNLLLPEKICAVRQKVNSERPRHYLVDFVKKIEHIKLVNFLKKLTPESLRIKGLVNTENGWQHVDVVGNDIQIRAFNGSKDNSSLVVISAIGVALFPKLEEAWQDVGIPGKITENKFNQTS
ncbi:MAG: GTP-binding protein [Clostridia bacterium]